MTTFLFFVLLAWGFICLSKKSAGWIRDNPETALRAGGMVVRMFRR